MSVLETFYFTISDPYLFSVEPDKFTKNQGVNLFGSFKSFLQVSLKFIQLLLR